MESSSTLPEYVSARAAPQPPGRKDHLVMESPNSTNNGRSASWDPALPAKDQKGSSYMRGDEPDRWERGVQLVLDDGGGGMRQATWSAGEANGRMAICPYKHTLVEKENYIQILKGGEVFFLLHPPATRREQSTLLPLSLRFSRAIL